MQAQLIWHKACVLQQHQCLAVQLWLHSGIAKSATHSSADTGMSIVEKI
jgi:hypothetical protein